ncbi:MAG: Na(+)/H(+) antiporter subunit D [Firmicutes bacterium]|nr:Na(+)/H(+) antiporter subunit D [Bacillota bacterium]
MDREVADMLNWLHPGFILIITGILMLVLPEKLRRIVMIAGPALTVAAVLLLQEGSWLDVEFIPEITLKLLEVDRLAVMFGVIFAAGSLIAAIYAVNSGNRFENAAEAIYAGASMSVVFAGDWISMIFFWEIMAIASWLIIISSKTEKASKAGFRYLLVHMFGGNMLLAGIILKITQGSFGIECLTGTQDAAFWLILIGVAVNATIPPLHSWIADAYPEAPMGGTVYMASYTTKVGVYCIIKLFAGTEMLLWFGVIMAIFGASMALIENDLRRLFSYHIVSQLGYIVAAAAVGGAVGIDGAAAHTFNNILYKGVLFMCCGAVITATGRRKISQLGGLAKEMPLVAGCFLIASLAITGFPLLNGFVSKSLVMNAMAEGGYHVAEIFLMIASVGTLLSIALKVNYFVFFGKGVREKVEAETGPIEIKPVPLNMKVAMVIGALGCFIVGVMPNLLYGLTPFQSDGHPFTADHVTQYIQLFAAATVAFVMYLDHMAPHEMLTLDTDWLYRKPLKYAVNGLSAGVTNLFNSCYSLVCRLVGKGNVYLHKPSKIAEDAGLHVPERNHGIEDDDVLQKPAGMLVATNMLIGIGAAVIAVLLLT